MIAHAQMNPIPGIPSLLQPVRNLALIVAWLQPSSKSTYLFV